MQLTEEQALIRDTLRAFARERLAPNSARWDREHHFPRDELKALGELGALGVVVPERWGAGSTRFAGGSAGGDRRRRWRGSTVVSVRTRRLRADRAFGTDARANAHPPPAASCSAN
jgi:alkylation response protein AidB-like acyl-CoA dehydrogenase